MRRVKNKAGSSLYIAIVCTVLVLAVVNKSSFACQEITGQSHGVDIHPETERLVPTVLHAAASCGALRFVRFLVKRGADIHARNYLKETPLYCAAARGHIKTVKYLADCGAAVDTHDFLSKTALHAAAEGGHLRVLRFLVCRTRALEARDSFGKTPLHAAARAGQCAAVRFLVLCGANTEACTTSHNTPLHLAAYFGHLDVVKYLLERGATIDVQRKNFHIPTPLDVAVFRGHTAIVSFLLLWDADINVVTAQALKIKMPNLNYKQIQIFGVRNKYHVLMSEDMRKVTGCSDVICKLILGYVSPLGVLAGT